MKTFIVATDLTERGDRAVRRAFALARLNGARLIVVTVIDDDLPAELSKVYAAGAERVLSEIVAADPDSEAVPHHTRLLRGDPAVSVATLAATEKAQLMVLGIHRHRPFADSVRDTTAQRILRQSACPLLVVRNPVTGPYHGIVAAVDFSPAAAAALRAAAAIAPGVAIAAVHTLHVPFRGLMPQDTAAPFLNEARAAERAWRAEQELPKALGPVDIEEGAGYEVLAAALNRTGADLIALGTHARSGFVTRLLGSFAATMLRDPPTDLILAHPG